MLDFANDLKTEIADVLSTSTSEVDEDGDESLNDVSTPKNKSNVVKGQIALVKRIIKAVQGPLEDAIRKESQLAKTSPDPDIHHLTAMFDDIFSTRNGLSRDDNSSDRINNCMPNRKVNGDANGAKDPAMTELSHKTMISLRGSGRRTRCNSNTEEPSKVNASASPASAPSKQQKRQGTRSSSGSTQGASSQPVPNDGGVPWFLQSFHPNGTTIEEEQWTGRDLVRAMSEGLSDMDEEQISGLVNGDVDKDTIDADQQEAAADEAAVNSAKTTEARKKKASTARRPRRRQR